MMNNEILKYYNSNANLKAANIKLGFTEEQIKEYIKCSEDPVYFINTYCKIVTLDHGLQPFTLYPCQINKVKVIHENRKVILMEGRQQGKCVKNSTRINIRNKITGEIRSVTIEEFHEMSRMQHPV
jgi:hypothetical protein